MCMNLCLKRTLLTIAHLGLSCFWPFLKEQKAGLKIAKLEWGIILLIRRQIRFHFGAVARL